MGDDEGQCFATRGRGSAYGADDRDENPAEEERDDGSPCRELRLGAVGGANRQTEASDEHGEVPPIRDFGVYAHLFEVGVVNTIAATADDLVNILGVPQQEVREGGWEDPSGSLVLMS